MTTVEPQAVSIRLENGDAVSGLFTGPKGARVCYVLAHGAGAGMRHAFMGAVAAALAVRGVATLRYQFPYMEKGLKRTDTPAVAQAAVRGAANEAARLMPGAELFAGGKSFGGRMTSQAQSAAALPGVRGLVFLGFPLHAAKKPDDSRGKHLSGVTVPMLFLQGTRDDLADLSLLKPLVAGLGSKATLHLIEEGNHMFHVPARTGKKDAQVLEEMMDVVKEWMEKTAVKR